MAGAVMARGTRALSRSTTSSSCASSYIADDVDRVLPGDYKRLYKLLNSVEARIGGDSGLLGMSGSVSGPHLSKIFGVMGLDEDSHLLDIGAGLGRPILHALVEHGCRQVSGIEFDGMKFAKAQTVISRVLPIEHQVRTCLHHRDVLDLQTLDELDPTITHLFSFWEGITMDARTAIGRLIAKSWGLDSAITPKAAKRPAKRKSSSSYGEAGAFRKAGVRSMCFVQANEVSPARYLAVLDFPRNYEIVAKFPVSMLGSCAQFQAFVLVFHDPFPMVRPVAALGAGILTAAAAQAAADAAATAAALVEVASAAETLALRELYNQQLASEFGFRSGRKRVKYSQ